MSERIRMVPKIEPDTELVAWSPNPGRITVEVIVGIRACSACLTPDEAERLGEFLTRMANAVRPRDSRFQGEDYLNMSHSGSRGRQGSLG